MRVAYLGNFTAPWTTETHVGLALEELGHEVAQLQENEIDFVKAIPIVLEHDLLLWTRTWALDKDAQSKMLQALETKDVPSVALHLDRYWGLAREKEIFEEPWWTSRYVFSADGGNQERFAAAGVNHHWLRPAVHGPECVLGRPRGEYRCDVVFVGSGGYHPEWPQRSELLNFLTTTYGRRFKMWPKGGRPIRGADLSDLYATAKVVVGDSCFAGACKAYWSDRAYETLGRGGFLIFPRVEGLESDFTDGVHLKLYESGDLESLRTLIDTYLVADDERNRIRLAGFEHVKANHTYKHRMREMLDVLSTHEPKLREGVEVADPRVLREIFEENVYRFDPKELPPNPIVVDVGGNVGAFSLLASRSGARVVAVEPFGLAAEVFRRNLGARATLIEAGMGLPGGLRVIPGREGERTINAWTKPGGPVRSISLSELMEEQGLERIDFLKVDCEGCEFQMFEDAPLEKIGRIAIEFHSEPMTGHPVGEFGALVKRLAEYGHVETLGRPSLGGMIWWRRYGL